MIIPNIILMIVVTGISAIVALIASIWIHPSNGGAVTSQKIILPSFSPSPEITSILWILSLLMTSDGYTQTSIREGRCGQAGYNLLYTTLYVVLTMIPWVLIIFTNLGLTSLLLIIAIILNVKLFSGQISMAIYTVWLIYLLLIVSYSYKD